MQLRRMRAAALTTVAATAAVLGALIAGCCGGAPTHTCDFRPVTPDATAPTQKEAGAEAPPGAIQCGGVQCDPGQSCCVTQMGASCIEPSATCAGVLAACDGKEDCNPGLRCCLIVGFYRSSCEAPESCPGTGTFMTGDGTAILCHVDADCPANRASCRAVRTNNTEFKICM